MARNSVAKTLWNTSDEAAAVGRPAPVRGSASNNPRAPQATEKISSAGLEVARPKRSGSSRATGACSRHRLEQPASPASNRGDLQRGPRSRPTKTQPDHKERPQ